MFPGLHQRQRRSVRPAPAGVRPRARANGPPDGWTPLDQTLASRALESADRVLIQATDAVAIGLSRRTFLRRVAGAGLVIGLAGSRILWSTDSANAVIYKCNCFGQGQAGPCGPSDICFNVECNTSGSCKGSYTCPENGRTVKGRPHNQEYCGVSGCWQECCSGTVHDCCDCCGCKTHSVQCTTMCTTVHWKCICQHNNPAMSCSGGANC